MSPGLRLEWRWLVALLIGVIFFVPPRRFAFPIGLPIDIDPYRLLLGTCLFVWVLSLLSDERTRLIRTGLEGPIVLVLIGIFGSLAVNPERAATYQEQVMRTLAVLVSFLLVFVFCVNAIRTWRAVELVLGVLVAGGAVLALLAVLESRTGWSPFAHIDHYLPALQPTAIGDLDRVALGSLQRDGRFRALGSAEHPVALGALFALLAPVAAALAIRRRSVLSVVSLVLLVIGAVATGSRTPIVMLVVGFALFSALEWQATKRFVPAAVVVIALSHFLMPGALGSLRASFDFGRIEAEQRTNPSSVTSGGRISDIAPSLSEFANRPLLGQGVGTRVTTGDLANARILDNQWLGSLLDMGLVGVAGLAWLIARFVGRLCSRAVLAPERDSVLFVALASAALAYAAGMLTFDSLAFTQVTVVFFVILAIGCALVLSGDPIAARNGERLS